MIFVSLKDCFDEIRSKLLACVNLIFIILFSSDNTPGVMIFYTLTL